jgi:hypothetical protein
MASLESSLQQAAAAASGGSRSGGSPSKAQNGFRGQQGPAFEEERSTYVDTSTFMTRMNGVNGHSSGLEDEVSEEEEEEGSEGVKLNEQPQHLC